MSEHLRREGKDASKGCHIYEIVTMTLCGNPDVTYLDQECAEEDDVAPVPLWVVVLEDGADAAALPPHLFRQFGLNLHRDFVT